MAPRIDGTLSFLFAALKNITIHEIYKLYLKLFSAHIEAVKKDIVT